MLLLHGVGHQLLLGALWADDVLAVRDEALADHAALAARADEAVVVPVPALERDEPGAADACFAKLSFQNLCSQFQYGFPNILRELMLMWSELSAVQ